MRDAAARSACRDRRAPGLAPGAGVQERARAGRMQAAGRAWRGEHGYERVATGHTASDQAETVLFRLARGTGRTGALGITAPQRGFRAASSRATAAETRRWCAGAGPGGGRGPVQLRCALRPRAGAAPGSVPALAEVHPGARRTSRPWRTSCATRPSSWSPSWRRPGSG